MVLVVFCHWINVLGLDGNTKFGNGLNENNMKVFMLALKDVTGTSLNLETDKNFDLLVLNLY